MNNHALLDAYCVNSYIPYQRVSQTPSTTSGSPLCGLCYNGVTKHKGAETKLFNFIQFIYYVAMWSDTMITMPGSTSVTDTIYICIDGEYKPIWRLCAGTMALVIVTYPLHLIVHIFKHDYILHKPYPK